MSLSPSLTGEALYNALYVVTSEMLNHPLADVFASAMLNAEETHGWPERWDDAWFGTFTEGIQQHADTDSTVAVALSCIA